MSACTEVDARTGCPQPQLPPPFDSGEEKEEDRREASIARMEEIIALVADPEAQLSDISRLIALEIASVIAQMNEQDPIIRKGSFRELNDHVKALRELQKTLTESDELARRDTLNMDGPKFQFMFKTIVEFFKMAMKEAGVDATLSKTVLLNFGDKMKENEPLIQRDLSKIEAGR